MKNKLKNNEANKLTKLIIKKLDLIIIKIKNDEVGSLNSDKTNKTIKILIQSKNIRKLSKAKKFAKTKNLKSLIFLSFEASSLLFIKN